MSWQLVLLQVDVLCGAGVLQVFLIVLLEGSTTDKTDIWNLVIFLRAAIRSTPNVGLQKVV